jgi:hypothetical protein
MSNKAVKRSGAPADQFEDADESDDDCVSPVAAEPSTATKPSIGKAAEDLDSSPEKSKMKKPKKPAVASDGVSASSRLAAALAATAVSKKDPPAANKKSEVRPPLLPAPPASAAQPESNPLDALASACVAEEQLRESRTSEGAKVRSDEICCTDGKSLRFGRQLSEVPS